MAIILRVARPDDGLRAVEIWKRATDVTHDFLTPEDRAAIAREVEEFLPLATMTLAVDENDSPLAFMVVEGNMVEALFVDPDAHGLGIGSAMMRAAAQGHDVVRVDVNEGNSDARLFYERLGFRQIGRSEKDSQGRSYPLIHLEISATELLNS